MVNNSENSFGYYENGNLKEEILFDNNGQPLKRLIYDGTTQNLLSDTYKKIEFNAKILS